ncbi:hypothetical protein [Methanobrevibacter filiformis]|uniref:Uncharacterized protein n=1 Tax=Methanobrevibacter filiformis TaxID=55758 RepID=A0A165ZPL1_9EURY|nr:hypothetical protein [Methanobrevibacter filiformis]KZX10993.1 hypothetical protein MBFIL_15650 [Methanobrevibacter filiformis]
MEFRELYTGINWKWFVIGMFLFAFIVVLAMDSHLEVLLFFSSIGLLIIGYKSQNIIQGMILGAVGTLPLFIVTVFTNRLGIATGENLTGLILVSFIAIGLFCGFTGAYFKKGRKKAIADAKAPGKTNPQNKNKKSGKNKNKNKNI